MYIYNFFNGRLTTEENEEMAVEFLFLGDFIDEKNYVNSFRNKSLDAFDNERIMIDLYGNFAKIFKSNDGGVSIITTSFFDVYYYIYKDTIFISDNALEIEDRFGTRETINYNSIFYYVITGGYMPLSDSFFLDIKKIPGGHIAKFCKNKTVNLKNYIFDYVTKQKQIHLNRKERVQQYADIIEKEASSWCNYAKQENVNLLCAISGVDSFNAALAYRKFMHKITMMHADVHNLQRRYVEEFIKALNDVNSEYVLIKNNQELSNIEKIITNYKTAIRPYLKFSTNEMMESPYKNSNSAIITGDLSGLTMVLKSFNTTLNQHSFYGRHLLGLKRKLWYRDNYVAKLGTSNIKHRGEFSDLYYFIKSLQFPSRNFDSVVPFRSLKECESLDKEEHDMLSVILDNYLKEFGDILGWNLKNTDEGVKIYRAFKQVFYVGPLGFNAQQLYNLHNIKTILSFGSNVASIFQYKYQIPAVDFICSKQVVYDYFYRCMQRKVKELGKLAIQGCTTRERAKESVLAFINQIPPWIKRSKIYRFCKKKHFHKITKRKLLGCVNLYNEASKGELFLFSQSCSDVGLSQKFADIEAVINNTDIAYMDAKQERYLNLLYYINERVKNK